MLRKRPKNAGKLSPRMVQKVGVPPLQNRKIEESNGTDYGDKVSPAGPVSGEEVKELCFHGRLSLISMDYKVTIIGTITMYLRVSTRCGTKDETGGRGSGSSQSFKSYSFSGLTYTSS